MSAIWFAYAFCYVLLLYRPGLLIDIQKTKTFAQAAPDRTVECVSATGGAPNVMWNQAATAAAAAAAASFPRDEDAVEAMTSAPFRPLGLWDGNWPPGYYELGRPYGIDNGTSATGTNVMNGVASGVNGVKDYRSSNSSGYVGCFDAQMFEDVGFNGLLPYYDQSLAGSHGELQGQLPPSAEPQVQWWTHK